MTCVGASCKQRLCACNRKDKNFRDFRVLREMSDEDYKAPWSKAAEKSEEEEEEESEQYGEDLMVRSKKRLRWRRDHVLPTGRVASDAGEVCFHANFR